MLRYSLNEGEQADRVENAVLAVLNKGFRTADIFSTGMTRVSTDEMAAHIVDAL